MKAQQQGRGSGDDDNVLSAWQAQLAKAARDAGGIKGSWIGSVSYCRALLSTMRISRRCRGACANHYRQVEAIFSRDSTDAGARAGAGACSDH
jgi:hypothetical protein